MQEITISEAIRKIEEELRNSQKVREKQGRPPLLELKSVEIELLAKASLTKDGEDKLDLKFFAVKAGDTATKESFHKIKIYFGVAQAGDYSNLPGVFPENI